MNAKENLSQIRVLRYSCSRPMINLDHSRRHLFGALSSSLLLHLLLFGWDGSRPLPQVSAPPLRVVIDVRSAAEPTSDARALPASPTKMSPATPAVRPKRAPSPPQPLATKSAPLPAPFAMPEMPLATSGSPPETTSAAEPSSPVTKSVSDEAAVPPSISADHLRQYRIDLAVAARRHRLYPAVARVRGWQGVVEVGISLSPVRTLPDLRLLRSSGHTVLDEQAMRMLQLAVEGTPWPAELSGKRIELVMPIRFSLDD